MSENNEEFEFTTEEMEEETSTAADEKNFSDELNEAGNQVVKEIERLFEEGNVRRLVVKSGEDTLLDINLTLGVLGAGALAVFATMPALIIAAVAAIAAATGKVTIAIERTDGSEEVKEIEIPQEEDMESEE
jgi:hypothetical protein